MLCLNSITTYKQELFREISDNLKLVELPDGKQLFTTILEKCLGSPLDADVSDLSP